MQWTTVVYLYRGLVDHSSHNHPGGSDAFQLNWEVDYSRHSSLSRYTNGVTYLRVGDHFLGGVEVGSTSVATHQILLDFRQRHQF